MKVTNFASNMTVVETNDGKEILYSYSTPVAAYVPGMGYVKTERKWSATTTRHINKWKGYYHSTQPQEFFDNLT